ncbi:MAG TPA: hypothetical protein VLA21_08750 [Candidatus Limnocylindria bacterium]|nr:hypothetical protein [Candidatus Limnocylindria bacterium]
MNRRNLAILPALVLFLSLWAAPALAGSGRITDVRAVPYSATQLKVSWNGPGSVFVVNHGVPDGDFNYYDTAYASSIILSVVPGATYWVTVSFEDQTGETEPVYVTMPRAGTAREFNYRYKNFRAYFVNPNNRLEFWEDDSRTPFERIQGVYLSGAGELRNYAAGVEFTVSRTKADKEFNYIVVLYAPGELDYYVNTGTEIIPGSWTSGRFAVDLTYPIQTYLDYNGAFTPGRYDLELYINGWLGGRTSFVVD